MGISWLKSKPHTIPAAILSEECCRACLKRDDTRAETRFGLSEKNTSPFKLAGGGGQFSRLLAAEVCGISGSNAGYTMF
jgi:hypothetical protein